VEAACTSLTGQAIVSAGTVDLGVDMRGVVPLEQEACTPLGRYVQSGSWRTLAITPDGIAMGSGVAEKLGVRVGDQARIVAPGGLPQNLKVVAIYEAGVPPIDKTRVYVNLTTAQAVLRRADVVGRIELRLWNPFESQKLAMRLERITGYDVESWQEANANFLALFDMQNMIINMVIAAILVVGGFGILAVQIMIVLQKTRDIAILRSVGLRRRDILLIFLIQGVIVALLGALLGDLCGWRLVEFLGTLKVKTEALVKTSTFLVYKDPMFYLYGTVFALVTGISASLLPAVRASRVEPVDVLRGQI
jgi:lipoprotein-releasing system permease protein